MYPPVTVVNAGWYNEWRNYTQLRTRFTARPPGCFKNVRSVCKCYGCLLLPGPPLLPLVRAKKLRGANHFAEVGAQQLVGDDHLAEGGAQQLVGDDHFAEAGGQQLVGDDHFAGEVDYFTGEDDQLADVCKQKLVGVDHFADVGGEKLVGGDGNARN